MATKPTLNTDQKTALKAILKFLEHPAANLFVLRGYAGTGKTFLMQQLATWLKLKEKKFCMLASTGRAATVLKGKTGLTARTVHSELYNFSKVDGIDGHAPVDDSTSTSGQMSLQFLTRIPDTEEVLYIVDESSMLSGDLTVSDNFATFGSGVLLYDFFEVVGKNKIIFVGDPCQLPPVGQAISPALDTDWLQEQNRVPVSFTLEKIERTDASNGILALASAIRVLSQQTEWEKWIRLPVGALNNINLYANNELLFDAYVDKYQTAGMGGALAIARSNRVVQNINTGMRRVLYGRADMPVQVGDVLLVTQNNYKVPLTNGDFVTVMGLYETEERAGLKFQKVLIKAAYSGSDFELLLCLDCLKSLKGDLNREQTRELMIDFNNRMRLKNISLNDDEFRQRMMDDDYLNAIKATYGYAVTCHKAQGGEWDNVFLFLDKGMYMMPPPELCKWWYTAVTRAKKELYLVNDWWVR